ncbi:TorD/DmsD family molecular chaperone [Caviibacterium pharyngocola]|uniref:Molecular chaperone n=1 Tax=Caviibacterium pharyngocola TaxID=28159 RepID=A0A2M8RYP7_9PAST|nr:molecular chaperone [Caviibacterium pharyngocola]PJG84008.1 hypothetical protein CVP04_00705 [Caviibacterium pharyngocola]
MTTENNLNNFSLVSRLFGNLFYRAPTDPILKNIFVWLRQNGLSQVWALEGDTQSKQALENLQLPLEPQLLEQEYQRLFGGETPLANPALSAYGIDVAAFESFRQERGMPALESADHFGLVFLTASWIEDNLDSVAAQKELFERFLLPCATQFLARTESQANLPFYRALAVLSRDILAAAADELDETDEE